MKWVLKGLRRETNRLDGKCMRRPFLLLRPDGNLRDRDEKSQSCFLAAPITTRLKPSDINLYCPSLHYLLSSLPTKTPMKENQRDNTHRYEKQKRKTQRQEGFIWGRGLKIYGCDFHLICDKILYWYFWVCGDVKWT